MAPTSVRSLDIAGNGTDVAKATSSAATIGDLVNTVPNQWRSAVAPYLHNIYRISAKLCNVQNTIVQYNRHTDEGSFPPSIANTIKEPTLQFSKEFLSTPSGVQSKAALENKVKDARKDLLELALNQKEQELSALQSLTKFDVHVWRRVIADTAERTAKTFGITVSGESTSDVLSWSKGTPDETVKDSLLLWKHGSVWHYRAIGLARSLADRSLIEKTKNLSIKKKDDVEMKDADTDKSTREVVRDEMQHQMKLLRQEVAQLTRTSKKSAVPKKKNGGSNKSNVNRLPAPKIIKRSGKGKGRKK